MDNPWASSSSSSPWQPQEADIGWSEIGDTAWPHARSYATTQSQDVASEQDITAHAQDRHPSTVTEPSFSTDASVSDNQVTPSTPPRDPFCPVPETSDATPRTVACASGGDNLDTPLNPPDGDWSIAWGTTLSSEVNSNETQSSDQWEAARQEKEKLNRAVPPELLDTLLCHCQQVSQEIWPASETSNEDNWHSGFDDLADIAALLNQLVPADLVELPTVQFSATATAKAMNEALKLTRSLPVSARSPLSRLLASKGSLEWEKNIKVKQDIVPDTPHVVGWRVLEKEDRLGAVEESKPRKAAGGLLSFWSRRASAIQVTPVETPRERSRSPARSSLESIGSVSNPPSSHILSSPKASASFVPPPPDTHPAVVLTAPTPSAVSRFLNRFSRTKSAQHSALALSSDDLEFLSEIVPSASDPPDEDINGGDDPSILSSKLPSPILPPSKQSISPTHPSSPLGHRTLDGMSVAGSAPTVVQMQDANHTPNGPVLASPLSLKPSASFLRPQSPPISWKEIETPAAAFRQPSAPLIQLQERVQPSPRPDSQPHTSFTPPQPQKVPPLLLVPPLLPPPPVSPPQTPRPNAFSSPGRSSTMQNTDISSFHDSCDSDDEFSAFTSFPPSPPAPFPPSDSYPSHRSPTPPSPPPRRTYERTHYPSSSSISSILSPTSQTSVDQLCSTAVSASSDSLDNFVSPPLVARDENMKRTPPPPPLPIKSQSQHRQLSRIDTLPSRAYHTHIPNQTFASPTIHTSLMNDTFSALSVRNAEHQRTQSLVSHAAAYAGGLWPNSPDSDEQKVMAIPPPSSFTPPKSSIGEQGFDLLGDGNTLSGDSEAFPPPLSVVGSIGMVSTLSSSASRGLFGVAGSRGKGLGSGNQPQSSLPPLPSTSTPILPLSPLGIPHPATATNAGSLQPAKPKQAGGLSAQDLSFFEGL